jgi:hypothetical protein
MIEILVGIAITLLILLLVCNWDRTNWMESCAGQANLRITEYNRAQEAERLLAIADGYLSSIALHHPHLVPIERVGEDEYRLTIYDTEQSIMEEGNG